MKNRLRKNLYKHCRAVCTIILPSILFFNSQAQNANLVVAPAGKFVVAGGTLVLNNSNIATAGTFDASNATVLFSGTANTTITSNTYPLVIKTFTLTKGAGTVTLNSNNVSVNDAINFNSGLIELNGQTLALTGTGYLNGESETARITGTTFPSGGVSAASSEVNSPLQYNMGSLGASITSSQDLGAVSMLRTHMPKVNPSNPSQTGIQRTYLIQPENNAALNATLRFYYLNAELNGKNANDLTLWSSADGITWVNSGYTTRNTTDKYLEKTGLATMGYFTLTDAANALPVILNYFKVTCKENYALVEWKSATEINANYFEVQRSADAVDWTDLQIVKAQNAANGAAYSYSDDNPQPAAFYRLKIVDKSGNINYSAVFSGGCADVGLPFAVYPNPATTQAFAQVSVRQATKAAIQIYSTKGQLVYSNELSLQIGNNQIVLPVQQLASGLYVVKLLLNNTMQQVKLIKQ